MRYEELMGMARTMSREEVAANIFSLAMDPRFAAVLALLDKVRNDFVVVGSSQGLAAHHGSLAHCMGSVYAVEIIQGQIKHGMVPKPVEDGPEGE